MAVCFSPQRKSVECVCSGRQWGQSLQRGGDGSLVTDSFFLSFKGKKAVCAYLKISQKNILVLQLIGWSWTCLYGCALKFYDRMVSRKISPIFLYKILTALVIISKLGK